MMLEMRCENLDWIFLYSYWILATYSWHSSCLYDVCSQVPHEYGSLTKNKKCLILIGIIMKGKKKIMTSSATLCSGVELNLRLEIALVYITLPSYN